MVEYSLGIDLHKKFAYWTLLDQNRTILWQGKVDTNSQETRRALTALPVAASQMQAVIEPVEQWGWYADILESQQIAVSLANPLQVHLIAKSRLKHDKVDSKILAELLRSGFLPTSYLAPHPVRELRELLRARMHLVRIQTQCKNRIHGVMAKHGLRSPESDLFGKKGLVWLNAQNLRPVYRLECDMFLRMLAAAGQELRGVQQEIKARVKTDAETQLLMTIPGLGPFTALLVKAEVGSFERFSLPEKLAAYAGLVSSSHSSGGTLRLGKITKQGSRYLRWAMVQAAQRVNPKWGQLWTFYHRIQIKKGNKIARVALARKMLEVAWYLIKKGEPFQVLPSGSSGGVKR